MRSFFTVLLIGMVCHFTSGQCHIDSVFIKSILIDPTGANNNFDTNGDGSVNSQDEYIEICNSASSSTVVISGWQFGDDDSGAYPDYIIPDSIFLAPGECLLIINDYCPDIDPPPVCATPADILSIDLNNSALLGNSGDVITMSNADGSSSCTLVYGGINCSDVDPLDISPFDINNCDNWGSDTDGCPLLISGDSCTYLPVALPIDLVEFTARKIYNNAVLLEWITESELNNDKFMIEWSRDAASFELIDVLNGAGTSSEQNFYSYVHEDPILGLNYYRLKQIDYNGLYSYSELRAVKLQKHENPIVAPNIFSSEIRILGNSESYDIEIFDSSGRLRVKKDDILSGSYFNLSHLEPAFYVIRIFDGIESFNYPIIQL